MKFLSRNLSQYSHQAPFSIVVSKIGQPTQPTVDWGPQAARERDRNCLSTVPRPRPRLVSALIRSSLAGVSRLVFARQYRTTDRQAVSKPRSGEPADRPGVLAERKRKRRLSRERQNGHTAAAANAGAADKPDFSAALLVGLL